MGWLDWFRSQPQVIEADKESHRIEPRRKPRVIMSLDHSWMNWTGILWFTHYRLIRRAGGIPLRVYFGKGPDPDNLDDAAGQIMETGDALFLSGGGDVDPALYGSNAAAKNVNPKRDRFELALIRYALKHNLPILGTCRGCQLLNVALGGTLITIRNHPQLKAYHNRLRAHPVFIEPDSYFAKMVGGEFLGHIRSIHGQAVDQPGEGLRIVARAEDGTPEAYESTGIENGNWIVGVQWHPELMPFKNQEHRLIDHFVSSC